MEPDPVGHDDPGQPLIDAIIEAFDHGVLPLDDADRLVSGNSLGLTALREGHVFAMRGTHVSTAAAAESIPWLTLRTRAAKGARGMDVFGSALGRIVVAVAPIRPR